MGKPDTQKPNDLLDRQDLMEVLRTSGLRITVQRLAVLDALQRQACLQQQQQLCAPGLREELDQRGTPLPLAACYRILAQFESAGIVTRRFDETSGRAVAVYVLKQERFGAAVEAARFCCVRCKRLVAFHDQAVLERLHALAQACGFEWAPSAVIDIPAVCQPCAALSAGGTRKNATTPFPFPAANDSQRIGTSSHRS